MKKESLKNIVSVMIENEYGKTRAEWQLIESGNSWDGTLLRKSDIHKNIYPGKSYSLLPYYGGLYPSKIEMWGAELIFVVTEQNKIYIPR